MKPKCNVVMKEYQFAADYKGEHTKFSVLAESVAAAKLRLPHGVKGVVLIREVDHAKQ